MTIAPAGLRAAIADADPKVAALIGPIEGNARRKRVGWSLRPGEPAVTLRVPLDKPNDAIVRIVLANRHRIAQTLLEGQRRAPQGTPVKQLVDGTGFAFLGENVCLRIVDQATVPLRLVSGTGRGRFLELARPALRHGAKPFIDWYSREGTRWAQQEAATLWRLLGSNLPMPQVVVTDIGKTRWGVYTGGDRKHLVRISWRTLQLPPTYARLVLLHELVHATRPAGTSHGPQFWRRFEASRPGARRDQRTLQKELSHQIWEGEINP